MNDERRSQSIIERTSQYYSESAIKSRENIKAMKTAVEFLSREFEQFKKQRDNLFGAYNLIEKHYELSEELKNNNELGKEISIFEALIKNLGSLEWTIERHFKACLPDYKDSYASLISENLEKITRLANDLKTLNTELKKTLDTTLLYDVATTIKRAYPGMYGVYAGLVPLGFICAIFLTLFPLVAIPLFAIIAAVSILIPVVHGITLLLENKTAANNAIKLNTQNLNQLMSITTTIENELPPLTCNNLVDQKNKTIEKPTYSFKYQPIYSGNTNKEKLEHFLDSDTVTYIQSTFNPKK